MKISRLLGIVICLFFLFQSFSVISQHFQNGKSSGEAIEKPVEQGRCSKSFQIAYTTSYDSNQITPIDLETGHAGHPIILDYNPKQLVVAPNAKIAYIFPENSPQIIPLELQTGLSQDPLVFDSNPKLMSISSDSRCAYVICESSNHLIKVHLETGEKESLALLENIPSYLSLDEDNCFLYISYQETNELTCFDLKTLQIRPSLFLHEVPKTIAIHSDGKSACISEKQEHQLTLINLEDLKIAKQPEPYEEWIKLDKQTNSIAISPDGETAYLTQEDSNEITRVNLTKKVTTSSIYLNHKVQSLAIYPKQTLLAFFHAKISPAGQPSFFDASTTQSFRGESINYFWNFGDGETQWTCKPFATHIYKLPGFFNVELTVTESMEGFPFEKIGNEAIDQTQPLEASIEKIVEVKQLLKDELINHADAFYALDIGTEPTTTTLTSSTNPSLFGQPVIFTATVTSSTTPAGSVTFYKEATPIGTSNLNGSGVATLTVSNLDIGDNSITAIYGGNNTFASSSSPVLTQTINRSATTTTLTSSANPSVSGQTITLTVTLAAVSPGVGTPTGTVTFKDGATTIGTGTLTGGVVTLAISSLSVGSHSLTAVYAGDTNFKPSTSTVLSQTVNQANTTTTLTSSTNPSVFGQATTLSATIMAVSPSTGTITGTVTFKDGATTIGTATVNAGVATLIMPGLNPGSHTLTAVYGGDTNFKTSTSSTLTQVVNQATTTTTISSTDNPSVFGQSITITATVAANAPGAGSPTGTVTFQDGVTTIGTGTVNAGIATLTTSNLSVASHSITAVYGGDTNFLTSTSSTFTQVVNQAATITTVTSSINPSAFGQSLTLTASVSVSTPGAGALTGTVTFKDGSTAIGTVPLTSGVATFDTANLGVGSHTITAVYNGDTNFATSTSSALTQVVNQATTTVTLTSTINPSVTGQATTLRATIAVISPGAGTPTGTVTFKDGATTIGTGSVVSGVATLITGGLTAGTHILSAVYGGDVDFATSTSANLTQVVNKANTVTALASSLNPSKFGQSVTFTASVSATSPGSGTPTGTVTFRNGATTIGTGTLSGGVATFVTSSLPVGSYSITAVYAGDTGFNTSTSTVLTQVVNQGTTTTTLASNNNPAIFGQPITFTATVAVATGVGTVSGTVSFLDGATTVGTGTISNGVATLTLSNFSVGSHSVKAVYNGDTNFTTSTSSTITQIVNQGSTNTNLSSSANPSTYGQQVTLTAAVTVTQGAGTPTGTVTFQDGLTLLGTGTVNAGVATLNISNLSVGSHSITATYSGDTNFTGSNSLLTQTVVRATPLITLVSSVNPVAFSSPVTFTVSLGAPTTLGRPSGTVNFFDGTTLIGTKTLTVTGTNTSEASLTVSNLSSGTHVITVNYTGDTNFTPITSPPVNQVVNQDIFTTTTIFSTSPNPTVYGQTVMLQANVVGSVAAPPFPPTGTVTFKEGSTVLGTVSVNSISPNTSTALLSISNFSTATHAVTATYSGDINYPASTSTTPLNQVIIQADSITTLSTSVTPAKFGQTVTLTANISAKSPGNGVATGSVQFYDGNVLIGSGTLSGTGPNTATATVNTSSLALGSHSIIALYNGDVNFNSSSSNIITEVIVQDNSTVALTSSINPSLFGQFTTLTATVTAAAPGSGTPTGTVTFKEGTTTLGTGTLTGGVATFSTNVLYPGSHNLTATYNGDANFITATSPAYTQVVTNTLPTVTTVLSGRNSSPTGTPVTFTAIVTAITGVPTGTVRFYDGGVLFGTGTLVNGVATATEPGTSLVTLGIHQITAIYSGDTNFDPSNSAIMNQYVVPYNTTTVLTTTPNPSTQGGALFTATVTRGVGAPPLPLPGTVNFYDGSTLIPGTVTFDPVTGVANFTPTDLHFSGRNIIAVYTGDQTTFAQSFSNIINQQVQQTDMLTTRTTVSVSSNSIFICQNVNLTATVVATQGFYTPTGSVTFFDGTTEVGTAVLDNTGKAVLPVSSFAVGTHTISATYNSDSNYAFSFSNNTATITVSTNNTTTTLTLLPNLGTTPYGQLLIFTAQVAAQSGGVPVGNVTFTSDSTVLGTIPVDSNGKASLQISSLAVGTYTIVATYSSTCCSNCFNSSSSSVSHIIKKATPTLSLSSNPNPSVFGKSITFNASVTSTFGMPTGTVTFFNGTTNLGTAILIDGNATLTATDFPAGLSIVKAVYNGDANFININFPSFLQTVNKAPTATALIEYAPTPSVYGQSVTFNAIVSANALSPTGSVTFRNGATILGTTPLNGSDTASIEVTTLNFGSNSVTATYNGDLNFDVSTSAPVIQTVTQSPSVTTVTSISPSPSNFGDFISFNVAVTAANPGSGTPTGTVTAYYGSAVIGTGTLTSGTTSFTTPTLPTGVQTIILQYSGDTNFTASQQTATQTVIAASSTTTLSSSVNPSVFGQAVTFTAAVNSTGGTATGTVSFLDGTTTLGTSTLNSNGAASITLSTLSLGTHSITAVYSGAPNITGSTSSTLSQVINKASTTTAVTSSLNPSFFGQPVTFNATVSATSPGVGIPTGTVVFRNAATVLGTVTLNSLGQASLTLSNLAVGTALITATYSSDTNFNASTSPAISQIVNKSATITTVTSTPNPVALGSNVVFTATVAPINTGSGVPTGTVQAFYGSTLVGTGTLSSGTATFTVSSLPAGTVDVIVKYLGDTSFLASSAPLTETITSGSSTTTLTSSSNPAVFGQPITFSATVTSASGIPSGTISFLDGTTTLGTASLNASGTASLTTDSLTVATHSITAIYSGNTSIAGSASTAINEVVNKTNTTATVTTILNPSSFGQTVVLNASVNPVSPGNGNPTGTVTFKSGATTLGTSTLNSIGLASLSVPNLPIGTQSITIVYNGDTNFNNSTSSAINQVITKSSTSIVASSTPNPSSLGSAVTLNVTVASIDTGSGIPTGTIEAYYGATLVGTGTLNSSGIASFTASNLPAGTVGLVVKYLGDGSFLPSSTPLTETITQASSTIVLTSSINPALFGQPITFTTTLTSQAGIPAGTVAFFDGTTSLGTATLNNNGVASFTLFNLAVATHPITAVYSGSNNIASSTSSVLNQVVTKSNTTVNLSPSPNPVAFGHVVNFNVSVVPINPATGTPTGTVTFKNGATTIGTSTLNNEGGATLSISNLPVGTSSITVIYNGDANFNTSTSAVLNEVVFKASTSTVASAIPNSINLGDSTTFNVTVIPINTGFGTPTGTIEAYYGSTLVGTSPLNVNGNATFSVPNLPAGTLGVVVRYLGDTNFLPSDTPLTLTVNATTSTTTLTSSNNPSLFGQPVTFTGTVTLPAGTPTGTLSFVDGTTVLATVALNGSGVASTTLSNLSVGTHSITAVYNGSSSTGSSTSAVVSQVVNKTSTTATLTSTLNPAHFGESVTFNATVSAIAPGIGIPTGTVTFKNEATTIGTGTLNSNGQASFTTNALPVGTQNISFSYEGDTNFNTSTSASISETINKSATFTNVTATPNPIVIGSPVSLSINVSPVSGSGIPTGTVEAYYGSTLVGSSTLDGTGQSTINVSTLPAGNLNLTVKYLGDTNFLTSTATVNETVNQVTSTTTLTSSINPSLFGQPSTFIATVTSSAGTPTGFVNFLDGNTVISTQAVNGSGTASLILSDLSIGIHTLTAVYVGNPTFAGSTSTPVNQTVNQSNTATAVTSSENPSFFGNAVTFFATVNAASPGSGTPTGTVTFRNAGIPIGTATLNASGQALLTVSNLPTGSNTITVAYSGDANFNTSLSPVLNQTVNQAAVLVNATAVPSPVNLGSGLNLNVTVKPISSGFGIPTGTIQAYYGSTLIGSDTLDGSGTASFPVSNLPSGAIGIVVKYLGDTNFLNASTPLTETVLASGSTTTLASSINPSVFGSPVTLTATVVSPAGTPSGIVSFFEGTTTLGNATLNGNGIASITLSNLAIGTHPITAIYSGALDITGSISSVLNQVVNSSNTLTTLTSSSNPTPYGEAVTFNVNVSSIAPGVSIPTGTITFKDSATTIGTAVLNNNGEASFTTSSLVVGTHSITATFAGNANFNSSASTTLSQVVNKATTLINSISSPNPANLGDPVTLDIFVYPANSSSAIPTGTVQAYAGSTLLGSGTLNGGGAVSIIVNNLPAGINTLSLKYSGDANFIASDSTLTQTVLAGSSTTTLTSALNPTVYGQQATFTATVTTATGTPTGTVTFFDQTVPLATVNLNGTGTATFSLFDLSVGTHPISAVYNGTSNIAGSVSTVVNQQVNAATTAVTLVSSLNPSVYMNAITLTATVNANSPATGHPNGTVTFRDGLTTIGVAVINNSGQAVLTVSTLSVGNHSLTATYEGSSSFSSATSSVLTQVITSANTQTTLTSSFPNPSVFGEQVSFFANVSSLAGIPTGTVSFFEGPTLLGTATLYDGTAIFSTSILSIGSHSITAVYNGNSNFNSSTTTLPLTQTVNQVNITVTTVTTLTSSLNPSSYGEPVTFDVSIAPISGGGTPTGIVTLYYGSTPLVTLPLDNLGHASYTTSNLPSGTLQIVAIYSGDSEFSSSTKTLTQVVIPITTNTVLSSSLNPANFGAPVTFTATVSSVINATPTGTVSFYDGSTLLGTINLNGSGIATYTASNLSPSSHPIQAIYNGNNDFGPSSDNLIQVINAATTETVILTSSPNPSNIGESISFIASTTSIAGIPNGTVSFYEGATLLGTAPLNSGLAVFNSPGFPAGTHSIQAVYNGNTSFNSSTSPLYIQSVNQPLSTPTLVLASSLNPSFQGQNVTLVAAFTGVIQNPTGTVTFFDDSTAIATVIVNQGQAAYSTSNLTVGTHAITAVYSGNATYNSSASNVLNQIVLASLIPNPPQNLMGCQVTNKFLNRADIVNILTWEAPANGNSPASYKIYRNAELTDHIATIPATQPLRYEDHDRRSKRKYTYYVVSVTSTGWSAPASVTIYPKNKMCNVKQKARQLREDREDEESFLSSIDSVLLKIKSR